MKSLVAVSLVVAQLLGWSAAPMYLCVSDEGAVCLDSGSANCAGCDVASHGHDHADTCSGDCHQHSCCGHDESSTPVADVPALCDGCDCLHLLVSWPQPPTVTSRHAEQSATNHAALFDGGFVAVVIEAGLIDVAPGSGASVTLASSAGERAPTAPTILRC